MSGAEREVCASVIMNGVQCEVCESVWMSPSAKRLIEMSGGCLRCDGALRQLTDDETAAALQEQATRLQNKSEQP